MKFALTLVSPPAVLGFGAAAWQTEPRDDWIGWSHKQRQGNLGAVVNNARFLILPWLRVPHLASKLLALAVRTLPQHWQARYAYRPLPLESFVEAARFRGTGYQAANWLYAGETQGCGKIGDHPLPGLDSSSAHDLDLGAWDVANACHPC